MKNWENKSQKDKLKMIDVFKEQIINLEKVVPNFKVANATIHFDESSPHLHIIGGLIKIIVKQVYQDKLENLMCLLKNL